MTGDVKAPSTGQVLKLKCNPEHTKAEWDTDADPNLSWKADEPARKERFEHELHPGSDGQDRLGRKSARGGCWRA